MDLELKNFLNKSTVILEGIIDDELPVFYKDCTNRCNSLAFSNNVRFDEQKVYDMLNQTFRTLESRLLEEYSLMMDYYKNKIDTTDSKPNLVNNIIDDLDTEVKDMINKYFNNHFDEFVDEFNYQVRPNNENEEMFKNELIRSLREKMEYAMDDLHKQFKGKMTPRLDDFKDEFKKDLYDVREEAVKMLEEMQQYLDNASPHFVDSYNNYINILYTSLENGDITEEVKNVLSHYKDYMDKELELLKQGYTANDYEENFEGNIELKGTQK